SVGWATIACTAPATRPWPPTAYELPPVIPAGPLATNVSVRVAGAGGSPAGTGARVTAAASHASAPLMARGASSHSRPLRYRSVPRQPQQRADKLIRADATRVEDLASLAVPVNRRTPIPIGSAASWGQDEPLRFVRAPFVRADVACRALRTRHSA